MVTSHKRTMGLCYVCLQVSLRWARLLLWSRTSTAGPCTFEGCRRWMLVSTAVWPPALLERPLAPSVWRSEVRSHSSCPLKAYFSLKIYMMKTSPPPSTVGPLLSEAPVDTTANVGENITLPCVARGFPQPTVTWHRGNGRPIPTRTDSHSRTTQLEDGHLLIQSELSMKHYHSKELCSAAQANKTSWSPCADWHD